MKKIFILILCIFIFTGCNNEVREDNSISSKVTYKEIDAEEAYEMMSGDVYIIDVREETEYNSGHIKDAINIPVSKINSDISNNVDSKDSVILLYCRSGSRAINVANTLVSLGYSNVYVFGGILNWPYELVY